MDDTIIEEYDEIKAILAKYKIHSPNASGNDDVERDDDKMCYNPSPPKKVRNEIEKSSPDEFDDLWNSDDDGDDVIAGRNKVQPSKNKKISRNEDAKKQAEAKKLEKQLQKEEKQKQRETKKEEAKRLKEIMKVIQTSNKRIKPEEAVKYMTANIDRQLLNMEFGAEIKKAVDNLGSSWKSVGQLVPNTVTWHRKTESHFMGDDGALIENSSLEEIDEILLLQEYSECVESAKKGDLTLRIKQIQTVFSVGGDKRVTLGIYNMRNSKVKTDNAKLLEFALTELQILCDCCHRFLESGEDFAAMVAQFTKSIAQAPFKQERAEKYMQTEWYMSGDNKDCVRVDKDGNGLRRLWQQILTSFPLARIETAEAIMSKYPTLKSLMEAYDECIDKASQERLLQDIPIRRAAGPVVNVRKIGPELSRKMALFFTSQSGENVL